MIFDEITRVIFAIIPTFLPPKYFTLHLLLSMLYTEYKTAAEKHLKSCIAMVESIEKLNILDNSSLVTSRYKRDVLHNLFYLSGYTLESISTYCVYKHYQWPAGVSIKTSTVNINFSSRSNFTFYPNRNYQFNAHGHAFQTNQFEVLRLIFSTSNVPIIDPSKTIDLDLLSLFNQWKPEVRYHGSNQQCMIYFNNQHALYENKIKEFVALTEEIYNSLLQIVG